MLSQSDKDSESKKTSPVAEAQSSSAQLAHVNDQRKETLQQKKMQSLVNSSMVATVQRQTLDRIMGVAQKMDIEEETVQRRSDSVHQFATGLEEELPVQKKDDHKLASTPHSVVQQAANHTGMPDKLKSGVENLSGMSLDHVKVHYNSDKPAQLNALAYAQGSDIHVGAGQEQHLPHEAWHVVQQMQGRVQPTLQMQGVEVNDDSALEAEADVMGAKALES